MTKLDTFRLRKAIPQEEFDYVLLTSALSAYSGVRQKINQLLKAGVIRRVKKGLYVFGPEYSQAPICKEVLANLIFGPSCISLEYALSYYDLIPERVETLTSVTPKRDKTFDTPLGRFTYRYLQLGKYSHGIDQVWIDETHPVLMATPEKALCDYVILNKISEIGNANEAAEFLESDLRIDRAKWSEIDPIALQKLNISYRSDTIDRIIEVL